MIKYEMTKYEMTDNQIKHVSDDEFVSAVVESLN